MSNLCNCCIIELIVFRLYNFSHSFTINFVPEDCGSGGSTFIGVGGMQAPTFSLEFSLPQETVHRYFTDFFFTTLRIQPWARPPDSLGLILAPVPTSNESKEPLGQHAGQQCWSPPLALRI
jgi:hypothetical protein